MRNSILFFLLFGFISSCKTNVPIVQKNHSHFVTRHAMVVSAREEASKIGTEIMLKGGNAIDAMVATNMSLAVCFPFAGNIGGGGFMVFRQSNGNTFTLDYREKAPKAAHEKMFQDEKGNLISGLSTDGALAVGVPGTVAGMWEAHQRFGKLPWADLIQPAIDLANNGFRVTELQAKMLNNSRKKFQNINKEKILYDRAWHSNDTIKLPNLAKTFKIIQDKGRDGFYKGEVGRAIVKFIQENKGILSQQDLLDYHPEWREPIQFNFRDYEISTMGLPSSGGIVLAQILKILEEYPLKSLGHNESKYIQLITEAERRAYADRAYFLGDSDFVDVPLKEILEPAYLKNRMSDFTFEKATKSSDINHGTIKFVESDETTHFSIVDSYGNAIAVTTTINGAYGSKLFSNELGFFFNNEMDDFSTKPGVANMFGLVGGEANKIEPEKRMLSSMTPTIVTRNGKLNMVLGTPGGSTIITTVLQTILNQTIFGMNMQEAVEAKRFHHQWLPDEVLLEPGGFSTELISELKNKGYHINIDRSRIIGKMDAIRVLSNGQLEAGADPRGDDTAVGF